MSKGIRSITLVLAVLTAFILLALITVVAFDSDDHKTRPHAPTVTPAPIKPPTYYNSCVQLNKDHPAGVRRGHPAYRKGLDKNNDGYACEK